ncbi:MAG: hypothetical protein ACRYG8_02290 [Janthinobacterium lividum]
MTALARTLKLFADRTCSPAARSAMLVQAATNARDELARAHQASPRWSTLVDGHPAATEKGAQRVITYQFSRMPQAVSYALGFAVTRSPVRSGAYRQGWFVAVNGRRWTGAFDAIPVGAEVMVTNPAPYSRKIEVEAMRMSVPPGVVEATRQAVQRAYPTIACELTYVRLPGGYVLHGGRLRRKDRQAGEPLTYPALSVRDR